MTDATMLAAITEMLSGPPASVMIIMAIGAAARAHNLNGLFYYRQIYAESRFNPDAVNPKSGCLGLGQMNPKYWPEADCSAKGNLELSASYMAELLERYKREYSDSIAYAFAAAAYNWGPANLDAYVASDDYVGFTGLPKETQKYVGWIIRGDE